MYFEGVIRCSPRERGVEPVAEIPDWMVIRLSDGSQERGN